MTYNIMSFAFSTNEFLVPLVVDNSVGDANHVNKHKKNITIKTTIKIATQT